MDQASVHYTLSGFLVIIISSLCGCAAVGSAQNANIEFEDSVEGLQKGDQVYLLGLPIGEIGQPFILRNRAMVPLSLRDADVFGQSSQVFFYIAPDQSKPGRHCLNTIIHSLPANAGKPRFRGFESKTRLDLQLRVEVMQSWWKSLGSPK
jgi:hypothetical protein